MKLYAWIKEELSRSSARSVAHYLYQHDEHLLSAAEHENICNCKLRRDAVEQLLKRVLMGPDEIFDIFIEILKDQDEDHIADRLSRTAPTDREILGMANYMYSKTCPKLPLKNRQNTSINGKWMLNEGRNTFDLQYF